DAVAQRQELLGRRQRRGGVEQQQVRVDLGGDDEREVVDEAEAALGVRRAPQGGERLGRAAARIVQQALVVVDRGQPERVARQRQRDARARERGGRFVVAAQVAQRHAEAGVGL